VRLCSSSFAIIILTLFTIRILPLLTIQLQYLAGGGGRGYLLTMLNFRLYLGFTLKLGSNRVSSAKVIIGKKEI